MGREREDPAETRQLRAGARLPFDFGESMVGAPARRIVAGEPEPEVIGDQVWSRDEKKHSGSYEEQAVYENPLHVAVGFALQLGARTTDGRVLFHVVGIVQH